jgi:hypothetical protein
MATSGTRAAAALAHAVKASGAIIQVDPNDFQLILARVENPLVVISEDKIFRTTYKYITSYKGLIFYAKSKEPLQIESTVEIIRAKSIWMPG